MKLKVIARILPLIAILAVLSFSSYAWFSSIRNVDSNNMGMGIDPGNDLEVERATAIIFNESAGSFTFVDLMENETFLQMDDYDTIFLDRNSYNSLIIKITINNVVAEDGICHITFKAFGDYINDENNEIYPNLSNVVMIAGKIGTEKEINQSNVQETFDELLVSLKDEEHHTFVNDSIKELTIGMDISYNASDVVNGKLTFDFQIKYEPELIEVFRNSYIGDQLPTIFNPDIDYISFFS